MPLLALPYEILERILFWTANNDHTSPPHTLIPLLQTHRILHRLALGTPTRPNHSALAAIARFRYSTAAPTRRLPTPLTAPALAAELKLRVPALRRIRARTTHGPHVVPDLWRALLMCWEDDGWNAEQLRAAGVGRWVVRIVRERTGEERDAWGWPVEGERVALAVHLYALLGARGVWAGVEPTEHAHVQRLLLPFILAAHHVSRPRVPPFPSSLRCPRAAADICALQYPISLLPETFHTISAGTLLRYARHQQQQQQQRQRLRHTFPAHAHITHGQPHNLNHHDHDHGHGQGHLHPTHNHHQGHQGQGQGQIQGHLYAHHPPPRPPTPPQTITATPIPAPSLVTLWSRPLLLTRPRVAWSALLAASPGWGASADVGAGAGAVGVAGVGEDAVGADVGADTMPTTTATRTRTGTRTRTLTPSRSFDADFCRAVLAHMAVAQYHPDNGGDGDGGWDGDHSQNPRNPHALQNTHHKPPHNPLYLHTLTPSPLIDARLRASWAGRGRLWEGGALGGVWEGGCEIPFFTWYTNMLAQPGFVFGEEGGGFRLPTHAHHTPRTRHHRPHGAYLDGVRR
ncbi:hypothetical protein K439DRAFT_51370 [Ramaria rubella]|nr:hypothetical protein K439DRAFT_51370 [Ramaria rubella]